MSYLFEWDCTHANSFHNTAGPILSELGFELVNDPQKKVGRYSISSARYKSADGLYLAIVFDPFESGSILVYFGRSLKVKVGKYNISELSNCYGVVAKRFGITVPNYYPLHYKEKISDSMQDVLHDLRETLPTVLSNVTLEDLIAVEKEQYGAQKLAEGYLGDQYLDHVEISELTIESRD